jgi:uncharacterized protein YaaN involved in tellurite resistance
MITNSFKVLKVASEINGMTNEELQVLAECLNEKNADILASNISWVIQDRQFLQSGVEV